MATNFAQVLPPRQPIAIIRLDDLSEALRLCRALLDGGITRLEFTLTNKKALDALIAARSAFGESLVIGVGTVLDAENARASIQAGAQFLVTPALLPDVIDVANSEQIPIACGAYTPTEILTAWRRGADLVKVFPASQLGPGYIKEVLAPLPDLRLVPTGGVNLETCAAFLKAGAYTVAAGGQLVRKDLVRDKNWQALTDLARRYVQACTG
ncbi:MAG: bifunctional 4-hydroxy-2-oxoglutarate aldolase/2-dehydro-3-deoxy-phosphogluconate aldolase [Ktedonobacteraceae bacterium]|nr:bifunctional 4-hydroxy-2-oxoglutarate aldolase/2-dehydro-3-deoxy-phosphogluconate aldolase [Ktedonobacteraceae bacterium]